MAKKKTSLKIDGHEIEDNFLKIDDAKKIVMLKKI